MPPPPAGIPTEDTPVSDLTIEAQDVRDVLLEVMEQKHLGKACLTVERMCTLLDPRRKLSADQFVNGSAALRTRAEGDLNQLIAKFADGPTPSSAPVVAPVVDAEMAAPAPKKKSFRG